MARIIAVVVVTAACASGDGSDSAEDLVLGPADGPVGMPHVATVSWQEVQTSLEQVPGGIAGQLETLGLQDAAFSVFVGGGTDDRPVDFASEGRLQISAALVFRDGQDAGVALSAVEEIADDYAGLFGARPEEIDASGVVDGGVGLRIDSPAFPGGAAAVAWVEADSVRIAFAQGGDASAAVLAVAAVMIGNG